jgi:peptidoglycan hydrolase-like protein with peptidoglycan-binding domain
VLLVQNRLKSGGYYHGVCHGRFDHATEEAVRAFEREHGLPVDGVINLHDYIALGLVE